VVIIALAAAGSAVLVLGIALDGAMLPLVQRELAFPPIPWGMILRNCARVFGLAFAGLAIQNWISLRWQSFSVAMAAGSCSSCWVYALARLGKPPRVRFGSSHPPYRCSSWPAIWRMSRSVSRSAWFGASWSLSPRESISAGEK
jgi:hypothetical protein